MSGTEQATCRHCRAALPDAARFCPVCGRDAADTRHRVPLARAWLAGIYGIYASIALWAAGGLARTASGVVEAIGYALLGVAVFLTGGSVLLLLAAGVTHLFSPLLDSWLTGGAAAEESSPSPCANCAALAPPGACFCPACGLALTGAAPPERTRLRCWTGAHALLALGSGAVAVLLLNDLEQCGCAAPFFLFAVVGALVFGGLGALCLSSSFRAPGGR